MIRAVVALALLSSGMAAWADSEEAEQPAIQAEISKLESKRWKGKLSAEEKLRLGEIYFLTSRCDDVKTLFAPIDKKPARVEGTLLICACGGKCEPDTREGRVHQFRSLLERGTSWNNVRVQKLWRLVKDSPEARYWALKTLRQNRGGAYARAHHVRLDLEKSLESLEVHP